MNEFIGKTIINARIENLNGYDDEPFLVLNFTDGTSCKIEANYGGYTGMSQDEYPRYITYEFEGSSQGFGENI